MNQTYKKLFINTYPLAYTNHDQLYSITDLHVSPILYSVQIYPFRFTTGVLKSILVESSY